MNPKEGISPDHTFAWEELSQIAKNKLPLLEKQSYSKEFGNIIADFSRTELGGDVLNHLISLAEESNLPHDRKLLMQAGILNTTEHRRVSHTHLRKFSTLDPISAQAKSQRDRMFDLVNQVLNSTITSSTGKSFSHIVNIGIGGSDLGPAMATAALEDYKTQLTCHFVSNVDAAGILDVMQVCPPESTLLVISSKTFTTQETMLNAQAAKSWLEQHLGKKESAKHCIAVTANPERAIAWGIVPELILSFDESVGGRFSIWSSIGVSLAFAIGTHHFTELLKGAEAMDQHFFTENFSDNIPVLLALHGIWNRNFRNRNTLAIIPYAERLKRFPSYLQQLDMESNGKCVNRNNQPLLYKTSPCIFGSSGTNAQHAFMQMMHQGTDCIPTEFIGFINQNNQIDIHQQILLTNLVAQAEALAYGEYNKNNCQNFPGNTPSVMLLFDELNPYNLGSLLALYEHKIFVQGSIWNINSFDQYGVELGKKLTKKYLENNEQESEPEILSLIKKKTKWKWQ